MQVKHKHELFFTDDEIVARGAKISPRGAGPHCPPPLAPALCVGSNRETKKQQLLRK